MASGVKINFVGHSCFVYEVDGCRILCDPWLSGRVFHDGWDLYSPIDITMADLDGFQYLWISHEHPDHFHVPTLRAIPEGRRSEITVLLQTTIDRRVAEFCGELGFRAVRELSPDWIFPCPETAPGLEVLCVPAAEGNSWIAFRSGGTTVLNLNDCGVRNASEAAVIAERVGPLDLLLTQFSYANWVGNPDQRELRVSEALSKLEMVAFQCEALQAKQVVPFASHLYFCHPENFFLNDGVNTPGTAVRFLRDATSAEPVVLYNNESYEVGESHQTDGACLRFEEDVERALAAGPLSLENPSVGAEDLSKAVEDFLVRLRQDAPWYLRKMLGTTVIRLWDWEQSVRLTVDGLEEDPTPEFEADIALHSSSLLLCLQYRYGLDTLGVSGRFHKPDGGDYRRFYRFFRPGLIAMRGQVVGVGYILRSVLNAGLVRMGRRYN
ncbi:MAG: MBL fold metallo-hydrolase [Acidimicrobiales bacterium]|nr:MBL fold metallo-hydrolase [Acidimicrobiales bacterium]